jgi:hypothetical protein
MLGLAGVVFVQNVLAYYRSLWTDGLGRDGDCFKAQRERNWTKRTETVSCGLLDKTLRTCNLRRKLQITSISDFAILEKMNGMERDRTG